MKTLEALKERMRLTSENGRLLFEAESLKRRGELVSALAAYDRMIDVQARLVELAVADRDVDDTKMMAGWLVNSLSTGADVLQSMGRDDDANRYRDRASAVSRDHLDEAGAAEMERTRAAALTGEGRFNEALVALATARDFAERHGDPAKRVRISLDRADILQWLGDFERAREELESASQMLAPLIKGGTPTQTSVLADLLSAMTNIQTGATPTADPVQTVDLYRSSTEVDYYGGLVARYCGDYDEAERLLERVLPHYRSLGVAEGIEYQLAAIQSDRKRFPEALTMIARLEPTFRAQGMLRRKLAAVLRVKAEALVGMGRVDEAVPVLEEALADCDNFRDPDLEWRVAWKLGAARLRLEQTDAALEAMSRAIDVVDRMRTGSLGHRLDSTYLADKLPLFNQAIGVAVGKGDADLVLGFIERIKARGLALALRAPQACDDAPLSDEERTLAEISRRLDALEYSAFRDGWTDERKAEFDRLREERARVVEQLRFSDARWRTLSEPPRLDLDELSIVLAARDQSVLDMYVAGNEVTCVLLSGGERSVASLTLSEDAQRGLDELTRFLEHGDDEGFADSVDLSRSFGVDASAFVPADLLDRALASESVIFVPHGVLHLVPWAGLIRDGRRLFERTAVGVLPNLASLLALGQETAVAPRVALIGDPDYTAYPGLDDLVALRDEIAQIASLCADGDRLVAKPVVRGQADEAAFWRLAANDRSDGAILHAACHGTLEADDPLASGLLFTRGKADAAEIARSRLRYSEAVLSACSTGWRPQAVGKVELHGDDILGIPGAFLEAGVRAVVVSIPDADDLAARDLTVRYHRERIENPPLIALRNAQRWMLAQGEHRPFSWIGFTLYGCR